MDWVEWDSWRERRANTPQLGAIEAGIEVLVSSMSRGAASAAQFGCTTTPRQPAVTFDLEGPPSSARVSPPERQQSPEPSYAEAARRGEEQDYKSQRPRFAKRRVVSHEEAPPRSRGRGGNGLTRGGRQGLREEFDGDGPRQRGERHASFSLAHSGHSAQREPSQPSPSRASSRTPGSSSQT